MANTKRNNDNLAPKLTTKSLKTLQRLLVSVGHPLYTFLSYLIIIAFFLYYFIPQLIKLILSPIASLSTELCKFTINLTSFTITRFKKGITTAIKSRKPKKRAKKVTSLLGLWPRGKKTIVVYSANRLGVLVRQIRHTLKKPKRVRKKSHKIVYLSLLVIIFAFVATAATLWNLINYNLPDPDQLINREVQVSTKMYDRNGVLLYNIYKDENRTPVALEEIPLRVRLATLAIEDADFYRHPGFSVRGIIRAAIKNYQEGELTGGSTITQQLVKNTLLSSEKTLWRKVREVVLAVKVEHRFTKDEILEMYLNEVAYGGTAYGIQEASRVYFGKDVDKLTLAEAALLAGLPKSPTTYSPFGPNPGLAIERQKEVLRLMKINGYITEEQIADALDMQIKFNQNRENIRAPHFVFYTREILEEKYGKELVEQGGLEVVTTIDNKIQQLAQDVVASEVEKLNDLRVGNGAAIVLNPKTGEILAMVGSKDYFDTNADGNVNVTVRPRQPGSSIKVVNYAYALSNGFTPASILKDTPVKYDIEGQPTYSPRNYDGKFRGFLTVRSALAESRNVPAVKVLESYGVDKMFEMGRKMGIESWKNPTDYGLSLTLGGGEVTLLELSRVYATIANYGNKPETKSVKKITNYKGKVLEEDTCSPIENQSRFDFAELVKGASADSDKVEPCQQEKVLDERVAFMLIDILHDNNARTPAFGSNSLLNITGHKEIAVKTGTSNDLRDNLAIGFNQDYLVAVWVGNNDNSPMSRIASGITGATPIFNKIMTALVSNSSNHDWPIPEKLVKVPYCTLTGSLPCKGCPTRFEWFLEENQPTKACSSELIKQILEKNSEEEKESSLEGQILEEAASTER